MSDIQSRKVTAEENEEGDSTSPSVPTPSPAGLAFVQKDYALKIDFLKAHFDRLWKRFQFFITFETAVFAAVGFSLERPASLPLTLGLSIVGLGLSVLWFIVGLEDRQLVTCYRKHVQQAFESLRSLVPNGDYAYVGERRGSEFERFSVTRLPMWVAGGYCVVWVGLIVLRIFFPEPFKITG